MTSLLFLSFFLSFFRGSPKNLSLSTSAVFSRDATEKTADDLNDGETCVIRVAVSFRAFRFFFLSLSLSLFVRVAFIRCFCALFSFAFGWLFAVWCRRGVRCRATRREKTQKKGRREGAFGRESMKTREKKCGARDFRAERCAEEGRTRVRVRVRATDFLVLGGPVSRGPRDET